LFDADGDPVISDHDKADMFNKYFSSMGTVDSGCLPLYGGYTLST